MMLRKNFIRSLILINAIVLLVAFFVNRTHILDFKSPPAQETAPNYGRMPAFTLIEKSGNEVTDKQMKGSFWVADFIFTECPNQCPLMTAKFSLLQKTLPENVRLVSFSVDPERDSPDRLRTYAAGHDVDPNKWLFLTGQKETIQNILSAFHLGNGGDPGMHSLRFVFLDPELNVLGYYNSEDGEALGQLNRDIKKWAHRP